MAKQTEPKPKRKPSTKPAKKAARKTKPPASLKAKPTLMTPPLPMLQPGMTPPPPPTAPAPQADPLKVNWWAILLAVAIVGGVLFYSQTQKNTTATAPAGTGDCSNVP